LENWVESGQAPGRIVASAGSVPEPTRHVFPYPMTERWTGKSSIDDAENSVGMVLEEVLPASYAWDLVEHEKGDCEY
jgi:hypothetical protein